MKKFLKQFLGVMFGAMILGSAFALQQWNGSKLDLSQKRILFTSSGTTTGVKIMDINTGGKVIVYGDLVNASGDMFITDFVLSGYITWFTETDPIAIPIINSDSGTWNMFSLLSGDYATISFVTGTRTYLTGSFDYLARFDGSGLVYGDDSLFIATWNNLIAISSGSSIAGTVIDSVMIASKAGYYNGGNDMLLLGWDTNAMQSANQSVIIAGNNNNIQNATGTVIIWGTYNTIQWDFNGAFAGSSNLIWVSVLYGTIFWGTNNDIELWQRNSVLNGYYDKMLTAGNHNTIIGGQYNQIESGAENSYVLGLNNIVTTSDTFSFSNTGMTMNTQTGAFIVNTYGGMIVGGWLYDMNMNPFISWTTGVAPATDTILVSNAYGGTGGNVLGEPKGWIQINLPQGGTGALPYY